MTPSPTTSTRTATLTVDGETRTISGRFLDLVLDLLSWYDAVNRWAGTVKITANCKGKSVRSSVEFFKE
jgi:hypothetical protein